MFFIFEIIGTIAHVINMRPGIFNITQCGPEA